MNYLAHFYLAAPEPDLMFGNYIGDGVKGSDFSRYTADVVRGIKFHRFIDSFTDTHEIVSDAKKLFYPTQAKFSGVVVDVLFDHMLAINWSTYHKDKLADFAEFCYATVGKKSEDMPLRSSRFYQYMTGNDILSNYATRSGIESVFRGMDSRTSYHSNMRESIKALSEIEDEFEEFFDRFFPVLVDECSEWKSRN